jgi:hypothetical protein
LLRAVPCTVGSAILQPEAAPAKSDAGKHGSQQ